MSIEHYENFPVASVLCPPSIRPAVAAIYHFARTADDIADEGDASPAQRLADLAAYRADLHRADGGGRTSNRWPQVFAALGEVIARHALPVAQLEALLDAFEQDVHNPTYPDRPALLDYCRRSANPVGRLLLHLYDVQDGASLQQADAICTALQLANFWQDLSVDLPRQRCYLPLADARRFGVSLDGGPPAEDSAASRALVADLVAWARATMLDGAPLAMRLKGRAGWELRAVVQGGLRILEKIDRMDHATLSHRPKLGRGDVPLLLWRSLTMPGLRR